MRKHLRIVEDHRADKGLRVANYFIDLIIFYIVYFVIIGILLAISPAFNGFVANMSTITDRLLLIISYVLYSFLIETLTGGQSIGKLITGTKVIMIDGTKPTVGNFFVRNCIRGIIIIDQFSFLGDNGFHDNWSDTRVIKVKNYVAEKQAKDDINSLGAKENF
ncbi:RDD family protein [Chryseobacterium sp. SIMBA_038]|uniref:RDD family protein n=1 Tax=Chryseobacterium sp. SIMBA_038 TaxID=3085780 RepID=UPI0039781CF5